MKLGKLAALLGCGAMLAFTWAPTPADGATQPQADAELTIVARTALAGTGLSYSVVSEYPSGVPLIDVHFFPDAPSMAAEVTALYRFRLGDGTTRAAVPIEGTAFVWPMIGDDDGSGRGRGLVRFDLPANVVAVDITIEDVRWYRLKDPDDPRVSAADDFTADLDPGSFWLIPSPKAKGLPVEILLVGICYGDGAACGETWTPLSARATMARSRVTFDRSGWPAGADGMRLAFRQRLAAASLTEAFTLLPRVVPTASPVPPAANAPCRGFAAVKVCAASFEDDADGGWTAATPATVRGASGEILVDGGPLVLRDSEIVGGARTTIRDGSTSWPVALGALRIGGTGEWTAAVPDPTALLSVAGVASSGITLTTVAGNLADGSIGATGSIDLHGIGIPAVAEVSLAWARGTGWSGRLTAPLAIPAGGGTLTLSGGAIEQGSIVASGRYAMDPELSPFSIGVADVRISASGISLAGYGGTIPLPDIALPGKVGLTDIAVGFSAGAETGLELHGTATFSAPFLAKRAGKDAGVSVDLALASVDPILRKVGLTFSGELPVGTTGLVLTRLRGSYVSSPTTVSGGLTVGSGVEIPGVGRPLSVGADVAIRLGPAAADPHLGGGVTDWEAGLDGQASVFSWQLARAQARLGPGGFWTHANLDLGPAQGDGEVRLVDVAGSPYLSGSASLTVTVPKDSLHVLLWDGPPDDIRVAEARARLGSFRHNGAVEYGATANIKVLDIVDAGVFVGATGHLDLGVDVSQYELQAESARPPGIVLAAFRPATSRTFGVAPGTPSIIVGAAWTGPGRLVVTAPSGKLLAASGLRWARFSKDATGESVAIANPTPGAWTVSVEGNAGARLGAAAVRAAPAIQVSAPATRTVVGEGASVTLSWQADRGAVTLFADTDGSGYDGSPIATDLPASGTFAWTPDLPAGAYRVYAIADADGRVGAAYGPGVVVVEDGTPPPAPAAPTLTQTADGLRATWQPVTGVDDYSLSITLAGAKAMVMNAGAATELSVATGPGTFAVAVVGSDANGRSTTGPAATIEVSVVEAQPALAQEPGTPVAVVAGVPVGAKVVLLRKVGGTWVVGQSSVRTAGGPVRFDVANEPAVYRAAVSGLLTPLAYSEEVRFSAISAPAATPEPSRPAAPLSATTTTAGTARGAGVGDGTAVLGLVAVLGGALVAAVAFAVRRKRRGAIP